CTQAISGALARACRSMPYDRSSPTSRADRPVVPSARLVGLDRSLGMLRQARAKAPDIAWVQADGSALPFQTGSFDFITCQFALHHIQDKVRMRGRLFVS